MGEVAEGEYSAAAHGVEEVEWGGKEDTKVTTTEMSRWKESLILGFFSLSRKGVFDLGLLEVHRGFGSGERGVQVRGALQLQPVHVREGGHSEQIVLSVRERVRVRLGLLC
ncbi:hypothetical protein QJS10_CPB15g00225 [Acorus calamus]|uniref:Uncharacterized protein n=1 Tax=Acorus calamus TaxID=4465 RepID=A0AAV9D4D4_ACOCL|nr:hypothetical protein QJS10_CPB15g00225 [Acorus calamus]